MKILKCLLMIVTVPVILVLTLFVWLCTGLIYISGLVLGLLSTVIALLGVAVLITYSPQNGVILLVMAFLISPMGLPLAAIWLLGKVQSLKFAIQDSVAGIHSDQPDCHDDDVFGRDEKNGALLHGRTKDEQYHYRVHQRYGSCQGIQ